MKKVQKIAFSIAVFCTFIQLFLNVNTLKAQCNAGFSYDTLLCTGKNISFSANSSASGLKYQWEFGDPASGALNTDTLKSTKHSFSKRGTYLVTLIVTNSSGCRDSVSKSITVYKNPTAQFTYSNACAGLKTSFENKSTGDSIDKIKSYFWNFESGSSSSDSSPSHTYSGTGSKTVKLRVESKSGCKDSSSVVIQVFDKPSARLAGKKVCQNSTFTFSADTKTGASFYTWNFGDSSNYTQQNVNHVYQKLGWMKPSLTVTYTSTKCTIPLDSIKVNPLPNANFDIVNDTQCFNGNEVCVKLKHDLSITKRNVIFDDGFNDDFSSIKDSIICHKYIDKDGGTYSITVELTDSNSCTRTVKKDSVVVIYPQLKASFTHPSSVGCFGLGVKFQNTSNRDSAAVKNTTWIWGDSSVSNKPYYYPSHGFNKDGIFYVKLALTDTFGCSDTFTSPNKIQNTSYVVDAKLDSVSSQCARNNSTFFYQTPIAGASIVWQIPYQSNNFQFSYNYRTPGIYKPKVTISKNGCDSTVILDSVLIRGPVARMNVVNQFQCQVKDTVYFTNASSAFYNGYLQSYWDAGDQWAPNCVINRKAGQNVGNNCNFSRDSLIFKHRYKDGKEGCYNARLIVKDTVFGCADTAFEPLPLMAPKAAGAFTASDTNACPGPEFYKTITFDLNQSEPVCKKLNWWVMWDSLQARNTSNFDSNWIQNSYAYNYKVGVPVGDSNGYVSIGLVIENGSDTAGKVCRDTAWYHKALKVTKLDAKFNTQFADSLHFCAGDSLWFRVKDTAQTTGIKFTWDFGDSRTLTTTNVDTVRHAYKKSGSYWVRLTAVHPNGCTIYEERYISIGFKPELFVNKTLICAEVDSFRLTENTKYYHLEQNSAGIFSNPQRYQAGKEQIKYDLGNGAGYQYLGKAPVFTYHKPGVYAISMAVKDSMGCTDTLKNHLILNVSGIYAGFNLPSDTVLCPQTLKISSTARVSDTSGASLSGDVITGWDYTFGGTYPKSLFENPNRYFATGDYPIVQIVRNNRGCTDTARKLMVVVGPEPKFNFLSDSVGCEPLKVKFDNLSRNADEYIWRFNDKNNNVLTTKSDSNVTLSFQGYGFYYPQLVARGTFVINGNSKVCEAIYPDTSKTMKRTVEVWEKPRANMFWVTNCRNYSTQFYDITSLNTGYVSESIWTFGDTSLGSDKLHPPKQWGDTGTYSVRHIVISNNGCVDTVDRKVKVSPPPSAYFNFTSTCIGESTQFYDSTEAFNDYIDYRNWTFGDGGRSGALNPLKTYAADQNYTVNLVVRNSAGCFDTATRNILIFSRPVPNFNVSGICYGDSSRFLNLSTSKQSIDSILWNYDDSSYFGGWQQKHKYKYPDNFRVKLKLRTIHGCQDSISKWAFVYHIPQAKIQFTADSVQCFTQHSLKALDASTIKVGSTTSRWMLGNQNPYANYTTTNISHRFNDTGTYAMRLISVSNFGCRDTIFSKFKILPSVVPNFGIDKVWQCFRGNEFTFNDLSSLKKGSYTAQWTYSDGIRSNVINANGSVKHSYKDTGYQWAMLRTLTDQGCSDTLFKSVRLLPMPKADFVVNDSIQCIKNQYFEFANTSSIFWGNLSYLWNLGNQSQSALTSPTTSYPDTGYWNVRLIATSAFQCKDTIQKRVNVVDMPVPLFAINDSSQCWKQNQFKFTNNSTDSRGGIKAYWNFGDGIGDSGSSVSHTYNKYGNRSVRLIAQTVHGCRDSLRKNVFVRAMPLPAFSINDSDQCVNNQRFVFTNQTTIPVGSSSVVWKFKKDSTLIANSISLAFPSDTTHQIRLVAKSDFGCIDSIDRKIVVFPKPTPIFNIVNDSQCLLNNQFEFNAVSKIKYGTMSYDWQFGDGLVWLNSSTVSHSYVNDGYYRVAMQATSNHGCIDTVSMGLNVWPMPAAGFTYNDSAQCLEQNYYKFTNSSKVKFGSMTYWWDLGEGSIGDTFNLTSPGYFYSFSGFKRAFLRAKSNHGCIDTVSRVVRVNPMPVPRIAVNDSEQCLFGNKFDFKANSIIDEGSMTSKWLLMDGFTSNVKQFSHSFSKDSFYWVKLIETSDQGCIDSQSRWVVAHPHPIIEFTINDTLQCLRQNLFDITNYTRVKYGVSWGQWDFGDGFKDTSYEVSHKYLKHGRYPIVMRAITNHGCADTGTQWVRVGAMPEVSFYTNDEGQCFRDQDFIFLNTSSILEGQFDLTWNFGGKTFVKSNTDQKYTFADTGSHFVRLVANSDLGCMDSMTQFLFVNPNPKSVLLWNDSDQCINAQNYIFTANSNISRGKIVAHHWSLDEGDTRMNGGSVEAKTYLNSGFKTIRLVNISDSGCIDSAVRVVRVYPRPTALIGINDSAQCLFQNQYIFNNLSTDSFSLIRQWWDINKEKSEITSNVNYRFLSPGFKRIYLTVESSVGCFDSVSRAVYVKPMPDPVFSPLREYYCEGSGNYVLTPNTMGGIFYGKNMVGSDLIPTFLWKDTIRYIITVNGCTDSSNQTTWIYPYPRVNLGADSILCKDELLELSIDNWNTQYVWDDGSVLPARRIVKQGLYWVKATNICGVAADSINIQFRDHNCRVYCPTAFTPNSDSKNDYFRPIVYDVDELNYHIYNRWGEKLFEGTLNDLGWDGTFGGNIVQSGSYIIMFEYKYKSGNRLLRGSQQVVFHLLR